MNAPQTRTVQIFLGVAITGEPASPIRLGFILKWDSTADLLTAPTVTPSTQPVATGSSPQQIAEAFASAQITAKEFLDKLKDLELVLAYEVIRQVERLFARNTKPKEWQEKCFFEAKELLRRRARKAPAKDDGFVTDWDLGTSMWG
jgi:hypothetical protein